MFILRLSLVLIFGALAVHAAGKGLLVVAPAGFHAALRDFVAYKQKRLPTELKSLEEILQTTDGVDDPEKLKRYLHREWRQRSLGYVLLVGDVDVLPVRYMVLDRITAAAFDYAFYPSDLYYSDLAKPDGSFDDWNARKDSFHAMYFGEVRGEKNKDGPINYDAVDFQPDVAVGRWPVSTSADAKLVATKTMAYEQAVLANQSDKLRRAAFFAVGGWVDARSFHDRLASRLNGWVVEKRYYSDDRRQPGTPPPDHEQLRALMNDGIGLALHTGHGQTTSWEQCFSLRDLNRITNAASLPIIVSAGCSTAYFAPLPPYEPYLDVNGIAHTGTDKKEVFKAPPPPPAPYQRGRFNPTGLGEQILKRSTNGGVAYIGCNTGSQPCALTLAEGFVRALAEAKEPTLGACWMNAVEYYYRQQRLAELKPDEGWYPPSIFFQPMKFMVFGDPSLRVPANDEHGAGGTSSTSP